MFRRILIPVWLVVLLSGKAAGWEDQAFVNPPPEARVRAYWWWLNGNVTKEAVTRDLEEMAAKGFGGALICDAGGAQQDGNDQVPHGPDFFSPEWRELYKHALREADRLGLEMSLNIQSGWNLGGPMVPAEDAPKKLVWSETRVTGPAQIERQLPQPQHRPELYRDVAVVAYPLKRDPAPDKVPVTVSSSSGQLDHPASHACDGTTETFWVSSGVVAGKGPSRERPEWLEFHFDKPVAVVGFSVQGRPGYGPTEGELLASDDGTTWRSVHTFAVKGRQQPKASFDAVRAAHFRLMFYHAADPRYPQSPRNVQVAEAQLVGDGGLVLNVATARHRPIQMWAQKALHKALSFSAPDTTPLLEELPAEPGEEDTRAADVVELTSQMDAAGTLRWDAPAGQWKILRFGCTLCASAAR